MLKGNERRIEIINILSSADKPIPAKILASQFGVSRQIIVGDIALINAAEECIIATNRGYILNKEQSRCTRIIKTRHTDEETPDELNTIVDYGGTVIDVFVKHKTYGELRAPLNITSRRDVDLFMEGIRTGKSSPLKNITSNYHYHTIEAESEQLLDEIVARLDEKGYLALFLDYEIN